MQKQRAQHHWLLRNWHLYIVWQVIVVVLALGGYAGISRAAEQSGAVGIEGTISSPPPTQAAHISIPSNGQSFTTLPVTVSGLCPNGLLVKLFKNNVFGGSVQCNNGSFSLLIDLFNGQNELVARVYDNLDQPGPDSNIVTVSFADNRRGSGSRIGLGSIYAKRGANPKEELIWPITLSGGIGPYAITVDWGDGKAADLISQAFPGNFNIKHTYESPGVYNIIVKATDSTGDVAYLQLVGVGNGALSQADAQKASSKGDTKTVTKILWQPALLLLIFTFIAFWLGTRHELTTIKKKISQGRRPF